MRFIPRQKARQTFEAIEDRNVAPGIAEITRGNAFRTEIYPVATGKTRTVQVTYTETLSNIGGSGIEYRLPFSKVDNTARLTIDIHVEGAKKSPQLKEYPGASRHWHESKRNKRYSLKGNIALGLHSINAYDNLRLRMDVNKENVIVNREDQSLYFSARLALAPENRVSLKPFERFAIIWDASNSMAATHAANIEALSELRTSKAITDTTKSMFISAVA